ncbi:TIGR03086 family metal-binding protein [Streptomyces sp. NPDC101393]|uniref:TIGR03086 family metal-binding protein n=1 Tax=Streptomyces sp. NPDC101393 TaxID=3366141 RepID=UPI00382F44BF
MIDLKPACHRMIDLLAGVDDGRLDGPTPCSAYTVGELVQHVDSVSQALAALAHGAHARTDGKGADTGTGDGGADRPTGADTETEPTVLDFGGGWRDTVTRHVLDLGGAWGDPAAWRGSGSAGGLELPNELWGKIALTEVVVHGWDLAQATGRPFDLPEETLRACLAHVADFVPRAPVPGLWGPAVEVPADAPVLDRMVAITGRKP